MGKVLYLDCSSGISGDMAAAALIDLGADRNVIKKALDSINDGSFEFEIGTRIKSGISCCDFNIILKEENYDHDMNYLHGHCHNHEHSHAHCHDHNHEHSHEHCHDHNHEHSHEHCHDHNHEHSHDHNQKHFHRGIKDIKKIIDNADMTDNAKTLAMKIFDILATAEAEAHNKLKEDVHFHEVGAIDSIADIVAISTCMDNLNISETIIPVFCEGSGTIRCQHGIIPIPVPAVTAIARDFSFNMRILPILGELITPTGAAFAASVMTSDRLPEKYKIMKTGLGAGKRDYDIHGFLRAFIIEPSLNFSEKDLIFKLESNIDDTSGEEFGILMDKLFESGARDVHFIPVFMKKNRPAYILNVICSSSDIKVLEEIIFKETSTIGIRRVAMERSILHRENIILNCDGVSVSVKSCKLPSGDMKYYPEYESIREISIKQNICYRDAYNKILNCMH